MTGCLFNKIHIAHKETSAFSRLNVLPRKNSAEKETQGKSSVLKMQASVVFLIVSP